MFRAYGFLWDATPKQVFPYLIGGPPDYSDPYMFFLEGGGRGVRGGGGGGGGVDNQNPPLTEMIC